MDRSKILKVIKQVKATKKQADKDEYKTSVKLEYIHDILNKKLLQTLKKEWKLKDIDLKELDWDWKEVDIKWNISNSFSRESVFDVHVHCPDQKINIEGEVTYWHEEKSNAKRFIEKDEKEKDDPYEEFEYRYDISIEISDVEIELKRDPKVSDNNIVLAPEELEYSNGKWTLVF